MMATGGDINKKIESSRKKFSNWLQCVNSLNETKSALHDHVLEIWKKEILSWDKDLRDHLPRFLICVSEDTISYKEDKKGKDKRKPERYCKCGHTHCNKILKHLLSIQQNPGSRIIWNNELCKQLANENLEIEADSDVDDDTENIPRVETSILNLFVQRFFALIGRKSRKQDAPAEFMREDINYKDIFDGCRQEHIWGIANMFMHHGKNENKIANTGPGNTDASMFFRMMKNCKLFEIEDQNNLYEEILSCRNRLHHSANNRVSQAEAEAYLDTMITFLNQFEQVPKCKDAIQNIEKMLEETILSVSVSDRTLRKLSEKALKLKKSALEVDTEIDRSSGFTSDETNGLVEKTTKELQKISQQPSGELSNIGPDIQEHSKCTAGNRVRMKDPGKHFENMAKLVKMHAEKEDIVEALTEQLNPLLDQIIEDASGNDEEIKESLDGIYEEERHEFNREKEDNKPCDSYDTPGQTFEVASDFDDDISANQEECAEQETKGRDSDKDFEQTEVNNFGKTKELLDQIVEDASGNDEEIKESLDGIYEEERHEFEREKEENRPCDSYDTPGQTFEVASDFDDDISANQEECAEQETKGRDSDKDFEQTEVNNFGKTKETEAEDVDVQSPDMEAHDDSEHLKSHTQLRSASGVTSTQTHSSHVWCVESEQSYTIKVEGDKLDCDITGCCMLPTGEILLADYNNSRLKKLNDMYQVISVCDLPGKPWDVCYCGNNEAVLHMVNSLRFLDVRGRMSLTREVETDHPCYGLTCHGNQLYGTDGKSVYIYSTDGIVQHVLYTNHSDDTFFLHTAVSDDGNYIYITDSNTGLYTIDSVGNHLYTLTDTELSEAWAVCVDGEGHVMVSKEWSNKLLQVSSDGKQKLGIIVNNISIPMTNICFNRSNATLIGTGRSDKIHVLKLK